MNLTTAQIESYRQVCEGLGIELTLQEATVQANSLISLFVCALDIEQIMERNKDENENVTKQEPATHR